MSPSHDARDMRVLRDEIESPLRRRRCQLREDRTWGDIYSSVQKFRIVYVDLCDRVVDPSRGWDSVDPLRNEE